MKTLYKLKDETIKLTPDLGVFSQDQTMCVIATKDSGILVNLKTGVEINLEDLEGIQAIKACLSDDKYFYILANKRDFQLGYYFLKISHDGIKTVEYLININSKLPIGDVNIARYDESH